MEGRIQLPLESDLPRTPLHPMTRALELARLGLYAGPNPRVGAVLVKGGRVVGEGFHFRYGGPHAEAAALRRAGRLARGSTLYVTLEPCAHRGKTPPCADAIIEAGVVRVVAAMRDPNPLVAGRGFAKLRRAGVRVEVGPGASEAESINAAFLFSMRNKRPLVILKAAATLDGKIASGTGRSRWITGDTARAAAHGLRARADAVLAGSRTVLADDPRLSVRLNGWDRRDGWPLRVLLDSGLAVGPEARMFRGSQRSVVFTSPGASRRRQARLEARGVRVVRVPRRGAGLDLRSVLRELHRLQVRTLLVEGGGRVHASFLEERLADRLALFLAPKLLGGMAAPTWLEGRGHPSPGTCPRLSDASWTDLGGDWLITGRVVY